MIVIVGAGITGLALAHQLAARGVACTVLEADERPGGVIRSEQKGGHLLEFGPQRTRLVGGVSKLVRDLGIEKEVITAPPGLPLYVYRKHKLRRVPFSAIDFLRSDLFGWASKLRALAEPFTAGARDDERVADFFTRKFGREVYQNLLGPLYGGLYASDPADMIVGLSLAHALREFRVGRSLLLRLLRRGGRISPPEACSFREGMKTLPEALYQRHRDSVRLGTAVRRLERRGDGFAVHTDTETFDASTVVITAPAPATAALLKDLAPEAARRIESLHYNPLAVVHLFAETELVGLGYQVSLAETLLTRGVTWNDSLFARKGVYTSYLGGAKSPEVVDLPDSELAEIAVREFTQVTGHPATALSVVRARMPAWDVSWGALSGMELPRGVKIAANWQSRPGLPGRLAQAQKLAEELAAQA